MKEGSLMYTVSVRVLVAGPRVGLCELRAATGTLLVACVCCAAISGSGHAAVIASWNMVGQMALKPRQSAPVHHKSVT